MSGSAYFDRRAQWQAFHRWESLRDKIALSLEDRIAWYRAAWRFSRLHSHPVRLDEIETKIRNIQTVRERLSRLNRSLRG
jgi:hypothetical protein